VPGGAASVTIKRILRIAITPGEPAGCGPDICARLANRSNAAAELVFFADPSLLSHRAGVLGLNLTLREFDPDAKPEPQRAGEMLVAPQALARDCTPGELDCANVPYVLDCVRTAAEGCMAGCFDALVTAPLHKAIINRAGIDFTGHTQFLADLAGTPLVAMMLTAPGLRVVLATTHLPLRAVADAIDDALLDEILRITLTALRQRFSIARPRLLVLGLNPHAGEDGYLGDEEQTVIAPAIERWRARGAVIRGPVPADTAFTPPMLAQCDAVVAMYHDQGLPVLKHLGFGQAVNVTLGLPFVRTSVDHGTALELAGTPAARPGSLYAALDTAIEMARCP